MVLGPGVRGLRVAGWVRRVVPAVAVAAVVMTVAGIGVPAHARTGGAREGGSSAAAVEPSGPALGSPPVPAPSGPALEESPEPGAAEPGPWAESAAGTGDSPEAEQPGTAAAVLPLPAAWWQLDSPVSGGAVADASGNGHVLSLLKEPSSYTDSAVTPPLVSLRLDRDRSQWGSTDGPLVDTSTAFSWSVWVRPDLTAATAGDQLNLPVISQEGTKNSFTLQRYSTDGSWMFVLPPDDKSTVYTVAPDGADVLAGPSVRAVLTQGRAALGAWTHLVAVYDKSGTNKAYLYVNGQLAGTESNPPAWKATRPLLVGGQKQSGSYWGGFPGLIRDVRIYRTALTAAQVQALYSIGLREEPGLAARWPLDDGTGTTAADVSGNGNPLTLRNGASWDAGSPATALSLNSRQQQYADAAGMVANTRGSYTVSAWALLRGGGDQAVLSQVKGGNSAFSIEGNTAGSWKVWLRRENDDLLSLDSGVRPAAGRWYHLVYVQDKVTADSGYLYVDGARKASYANPPWPGPAGALQVGRRMNGGTFGGYLDGLVRDVRVYGYALSAGQVTALYNEGKDGIDATAPQQLGVSPCTGTGCPPLGFDAVTALQKPHLTALVRAPAGREWSVQFEVRKSGSSTITDSGTAHNVESGDTASWQPGVWLDNGTAWEFHARTSDAHGWSAWSYWFPFTVRTVAPEAPLISSDDFARLKWGNPSEGTMRWSSPSPEVEGYSWQLDDGTWSAWTADTSVKLAKVEAGWHYFHVRARNHAGQESGVSSYGFGVGPAPLPYPDLNGDGHADVVVSTSARLAPDGDPLAGPGETAGSLLVIPGGTGAGELDGAKTALVDEHVLGLDGPESGDDFGAAVAYGDFDGDGQTDLAVGIPGWDGGSGRVVILAGQAAAPYVRKVAEFDVRSVGLGDDPEGYGMGLSLAAARFQGSPYEGLAIGVPGATVDGKIRAGAVVVLHGGPDGLTNKAQVLTAQPWDGHGPVADARFGWSLAGGTLTAYGTADLAVLALGPGGAGDGAPQDPTGLVYLAQGQYLGDLKPFTGPGGVLTAADAGVAGHLRQVIMCRCSGDNQGRDLIVFGDQRAGTGTWSGVLVQVPVGSDGLVPGQAKVMSLDAPGSGGGQDRFFGGSLTAGHLEYDASAKADEPYDDVALAQLGAGRFAGSVTVLSGGPDGIFSKPPLTLTAASPGIEAPAYFYDGFGYGLSVQPAGAASLDSPGETARLLVTAPQTDGDPAAGTLYLLRIEPGGETTGPQLAGSGSYTGEQLGGASLYGPGWPVAGGTTISTGIDEVPLRARLARQG
jgi:concanavalin A-like lectin/glucanase superfamily protein/FG-GAP repeat protein